MLQEQSTGMEDGSVSQTFAYDPSTRLDFVSSETNLDDVLQISNVFVNVSKGEVAKSNDLQKAFGKSNVEEIVKEVRSHAMSSSDHPSHPSKSTDPEERRSPNWRKRA